jgi:hypothetical protein
LLLSHITITSVKRRALLLLSCHISATCIINSICAATHMTISLLRHYIIINIVAITGFLAYYDHYTLLRAIIITAYAMPIPLLILLHITPLLRARYYYALPLLTHITHMAHTYLLHYCHSLLAITHIYTHTHTHTHMPSRSLLHTQYAAHTIHIRHSLRYATHTHTHTLYKQLACTNVLKITSITLSL